MTGFLMLALFTYMIIDILETASKKQNNNEDSKIDLKKNKRS